MRRGLLSFLTVCLCALFPLAAPAQSSSAIAPSASVLSLSQEQVRPVQYRQCSRRYGPYFTQTTAWQRWRQARNSGLAVSRGVVPCYGRGGRGYCFNVFSPC
jgi:hypothetical protein